MDGGESVAEEFRVRQVPREHSALREGIRHVVFPGDRDILGWGVSLGTMIPTSLAHKAFGHGHIEVR